MRGSLFQKGLRAGNPESPPRVPVSGMSHFLVLRGRCKENPLVLALPRYTKEKIPEGSAPSLPSSSLCPHQPHDPL